MYPRLAALLVLASVSACQPANTVCTETDCAAICKKSQSKVEALPCPQQRAAPAPENSEAQLSAKEQSLLGPILADMRRGVSPRGPAGLGICKGQAKSCDDFLGRDAGELPPGEYMLRAELDVPNLGKKGTWQVELSWECKITDQNPGGATQTSAQTRSYDVTYAGTSRGYRLSPLVKISSPSKEGVRDCTYTLVTPSSGEAKTLTGSWKVPQG